MLFAEYFHIFIIHPKIKISAQLSFQNITLISGALWAHFIAPIDLFSIFVYILDLMPVNVSSTFPIFAVCSSALETE